MANRIPRISQRLLEGRLRAAGWPYVAVDEAKKAIFADSHIDSFDFIVYQEGGPNLLVETDSRNDGSVATMREWGQIFGPDFLPVFARTRVSGRIAFVRADNGQEINNKLALTISDTTATSGQEPAGAALGSAEAK